jgi:hypothetical protein
MNKAEYLILICERVVSSRMFTQVIFDNATQDYIKDTLKKETERILGKKPDFGKVSNKDISNFVKVVSNKLKEHPHFVHNNIHFDVQPTSKGDKSSLFGEGYHHVYMNLLVVYVNLNMSPEVWKDAYNNNFDKEIVRLRSVIRHELAHRMHLEKISPNPEKRMRKRAFQKAVTPRRGSHHYYGIPTEIVAHANHTIELIAAGHERGWRETLASFVLSDDSRHLKNTKRLVRLIAKLMAEYEVPWIKRLKVKRELMNLARKMKVSMQDIGIEEIDKAQEKMIGIEAETDISSVRLTRPTVTKAKF